MYLEHFGLDDQPFKLTPDTDFFYNHSSHREALNVLTLALDQGEGILKVTGEVGTGKTLLCRMLLNALDDGYVTAYIPNPLLSPQALHIALAEELGVKLTHGLTFNALVKQINHRLIALAGEGKRVVVVVDEAQSMPEETLEALRLMSNLETEKQKLLQIVLFGQRELDERLQSPSLRQLRQRITFAHTLLPLDREGVAAYVARRLAAAGHNGRPLFSAGACRHLYRTSHGLPRLINIYAHKALLAAYGRGDHTVARRHVRAAVADGGRNLPAAASWSALPSLALWALFTAVVALAVAMLLLPELHDGVIARIAEGLG